MRRPVRFTATTARRFLPGLWYPNKYIKLEVPVPTNQQLEGEPRGGMLAGDGLIARTLPFGHLFVIFSGIALFHFPSAVLCS